MKIYIGADHNGFSLRADLIRFLMKSGYEVVDDGHETLDPDDDFPVFAAKVVTDILTSDDDDPRGILICGSGQGMCMAANRHKGIRAALLYDRESARSSRNDDNANIACLPADVLKKDTAHEVITTFLQTPFAALPRFKRRLSEIDE